MNLCEILSDAILFWILQAGLVLFALFAAFQNWRTFGRGNLTMQILRGDATMKIFYGTYAGISGLLVAICLSVDAAKDHRVLWVVVDTLAIF